MTKKMIFKEVTTIGKYDLDGTLDNAVKYLEGLIEQHGKDARLDTEEDYDGIWSFSVQVEREETDTEYELRTAMESFQQKNLEQYERRQYESLKKKFG